MRINGNTSPFKLASDVAEITKTLRKTPHKTTTKISPIHAQMGRKPNIPLSNTATTSSLNNLNWKKRKARLFR